MDLRTTFVVVYQKMSMNPNIILHYLRTTFVVVYLFINQDLQSYYNIKIFIWQGLGEFLPGDFINFS